MKLGPAVKGDYTASHGTGQIVRDRTVEEIHRGDISQKHTSASQLSDIALDQDVEIVTGSCGGQNAASGPRRVIAHDAAMGHLDISAVDGNAAAAAVRMIVQNVAIDKGSAAAVDDCNTAAAGFGGTVTDDAVEKGRPAIVDKDGSTSVKILITGRSPPFYRESVDNGRIRFVIVKIETASRQLAVDDAVFR
ncbi:hypothetical protein JW979_06345, partial [bacterium]|nr:hypothetical protein [candidate division CSSED10-310 bacterium]